MAYAISEHMRNRLNAAGSNSLAAYSNARDEEEKKNKGGLLGGLGYVGGQLLSGILGVGEGVYDFVVGGVADIFGAEEFSERLIKDDVTGDWQRSLNEWYNPSKGMQFVGDVASGLGQTSAYVGVALIPGAGQVLSPVVAGVSAGGRGVTAAYQKTGKLGNKEWIYGAASGAVEAGLEAATGAAGKIAKNIMGDASKSVAKTAVRSGIFKTALKTGTGEFFEEAASEIINPYLERWTGVDKNAENASLGEILRAGAVGFVSGAIGSVGGSGIGNVRSLSAGSKISKGETAKFKIGNRINNRTKVGISNKDAILSEANDLMSMVDNQDVGETVSANLMQLKGSLDAYNNLSNKDGIRGKMLLGEIARGVAYTNVSSGFEATKQEIMDSAEDIAEYLTQEKGQTYTAEDIRENKDGVTNELAIASFSSQMIGNPEVASELIQQGKVGVLRMSSQYEAWKNSLTDEQLSKANADLGIDLSTATHKQFMKAMEGFNQRRAQEQAQQAELQAQANAQSQAQAQAQQTQAVTDWQNTISNANLEGTTNGAVRKQLTPLPQTVSLKDGEGAVYRAENGLVVGVKKDAEGYLVAFDSADGQGLGKFAKHITEEQLGDVITQIRNFNQTTPTVESTENLQSQRKSLQTQKEDVASKATSETADTTASTETTQENQSTEQTESTVKKVQRNVRERALTNKARTLVKDFDMLSGNTKANIREMIASSENFNNLSEEDLSFVANIMSKSGDVRVTFADLGEGRNGVWTKEFDGLRYVQLNAANPQTSIKRAAIHELAHDMYNTKNAAFKELSQAAVELLSEEEVNDIKERYRKYYEEQGKLEELTDELVQDELSAYALENVLNNKSFIRKHLNVNTEGFISSLKDKAYRTALWFKGKFSPVQRFYNALGKAYDTILETRIVINNKGQEVRFQAGKSFAEQVDDVLNKSHNPKYDLYIMQTPSILVGLNFDNKPLLMRNSKVVEILDKHEDMTVGLLKQLPDIIKDPVLILKSKTHPQESVVIISDISTPKGNIIVPVWVNQEGNYIDVNLGEIVDKTNFAASAYGRNIENLLKYANENDGFLYEHPNKKRVSQLLARNGLQLPTPLKISNSIINISNNSEKVNPLSENSSEKIKKVMERASLGSSVDSNGKKLTEEQRKFFKDSKVRDKDGNLLAVYHNTNNEFTVFDKDKIGTKTGVGMFGKGFYFGNKGTAKGYGKNQIKAYINIKNPYYATESDVGRINTKKLQSEGYDGVIGEGAERIYVAFEPNQIKLTTNQNPTESEDIRFSLVYTPKITAEMSDEERYQILKDKKIALTAKADNAKLDSVLSKLKQEGENISYNGVSQTERKNLFKKIADYFGIFKDYYNADISLSFTYSRENLKKSLDYQKRNYKMFAEMLTCFDNVVENAVGIEVHNRNDKGYKSDVTLKNAYVLASAFKDADSIIPVKLEVKEFSDKNNTLYVAVALESIKKDEFSTQGDTQNGVTQYAPSSSTISLSQLFAKINPLDKNFLKYIPDGFLDSKQKIAKQEALREDEEKTYMSAIKRNDMVTAQRMVDEAAKEAGYTYKGMHGTSADFNTFDYSYISDDNKLGLGFYFTNNENLQFEYDYKKTAYLKISNPIFDNNPTLDDILQREEYLREKGFTQKETLKAIQNEFGYDGIVAEYNRKALVAFNPEQIKSADPVTYDDDGNVIPLSERFKSDKKDIRYSLTYAPTGKTNIVMDNTLNRQERRRAQKNVAKKYAHRFQSLRVAFVNQQAAIEDALKDMGKSLEEAEAITQTARSASSKAQRAISGDIVDTSEMHTSGDATTLAKGVQKLMAPVKKAKLEAEFFDYLFNRHNIDRLKVDKPVNGNTAEESQAVIERLEKQHPEMKKWGEEWDKMVGALLTLRVKEGIITKEQANYLRETYPHYVPTYREGGAKQGMTGGFKGKNDVMISKTLKKATGSTEALLRPDEAIARQIMETYRAIGGNYVANQLYESYLASGKNHPDIEIVSKEKVTKEDAENTDVIGNLEEGSQAAVNKTNGTVTFYRDGERITMRVSSNILAGFDGFYKTSSVYEQNIVARTLAKGMQLFKSAVTSWSPFFIVRNAIRDIQDSAFYTKNGMEFAKQIPNAWKGIATNSKEWQLYLSAGGLNSNVFGSEGFTGMVSERGFETIDISSKQGIWKAVSFMRKQGMKIDTINMIIEQIPRFAEFLASRKAGKTVDQALLDSADVTVNFGRSGSVTRIANRYFIPFINASVQGGSKTVRTIKESRRSIAAFGNLVLRGALIGIVPAILNNMMYDDDEDYQNLRTDVKENYYLFKTSDGKFLKFPKGRISAILSGAVVRSGMAAKGEEDAWEGYLKNAVNTFAPVESASRTIFSPFTDVKTNTTWYGTAIEGREFENKAIKDRYDETTSNLAIQLGKTKLMQDLNLSPKKIHYLIDQYTGVIGDVFLPWNTKGASDKNVLKSVVKVGEKNFTVDAVTSNKLSSKFYKIYDETTYAKSAGDENAALRLRYLNKVKEAVSDLYKEKDKVNASNKTEKEKLAENRIIQTLINQTYQNVLDEKELLSNAFSTTKGIGSEYSVVEVTKKNYKKLEEKKDNIGAYVITRNGLTTGKLYESQEKATKGLSDMIADYRYTEGIHLMHGAERALKYYNTATYEKAQKLNGAGVSYDDYYFAYMTAKQYAGDSEDKREFTIETIADLDLSREQTLLMIYAFGYSVKDGEFYGMTSKAAKTRMARYIKSLKISTEEKISLAKACGLTVKNGKIITK